MKRVKTIKIFIATGEYIMNNISLFERNNVVLANKLLGSLDYFTDDIMNSVFMNKEMNPAEIDEFNSIRYGGDIELMIEYVDNILVRIIKENENLYL